MICLTLAVNSVCGTRSVVVAEAITRSIFLLIRIHVFLWLHTGKVVPTEYIDKYDAMRHKVGDSRHIEKMTRGFVRLAKKVTKHSKMEKNAIETTMDLVEACNKLRILKINAMLLLENTDANMKTAEDEPIFLHMFAKAVRMDQVCRCLCLCNSMDVTDTCFVALFTLQCSILERCSADLCLLLSSRALVFHKHSHSAYMRLRECLQISSQQRLGTELQEPGDRKRIFSVLSALATKCDVDIIGREGVTAAHLAAIGDNSKLTDLLASHKADLEIFSTHDDGGMTPLMMAAKFGHVYVCADLIRHRADINKVNRQGMTALHYAGWFGQTRTAIFLLRVGADKFRKDDHDRTAARLAMDRYVFAFVVVFMVVYTW